MKSNEIERLAEKIRFRPSAATDERIIAHAEAVLDKSTKAKPANLKQNIWGIIMKNRRIVQVAVAAVIIVIGGITVHHLTGSFDVASTAYAITDVPELLKKAKSIHIAGLKYYCGTLLAGGIGLPETTEGVQPVPIEIWIDRELGCIRYTKTSMGVGRKDGKLQARIGNHEVVTDGLHRMSLDHDRKQVRFTGIRNFEQKLEIEHRLHYVFDLVLSNADRLAGFVAVGQEVIDGAEYDIWNGDFAHKETGLAYRYKCWLNPQTGHLGRIECWVRQAEDKWFRRYEYTTIEYDVELPNNVFQTEVPLGYVVINSKQDAPTLALGSFLSKVWEVRTPDYNLGLEIRASFTTG